MTSPYLTNPPLTTREREMLALLRTAVARVEIANKEGNPILSAWLPDAKKLIDRIDGKPIQHRKVQHGLCPVCGHYGSDCTGQEA